ncbi:MAG: hypothetical protein ACI87O_002336, partial [Planctomycetota bacterium]
MPAGAAAPTGAIGDSAPTAKSGPDRTPFSLWSVKGAISCRGL